MGKVWDFQAGGCLIDFLVNAINTGGGTKEYAQYNTDSIGDTYLIQSKFCLNPRFSWVFSKTKFVFTFNQGCSEVCCCCYLNFYATEK